MSGNRGQTTDLGGKEKYEATVLDFLDKETMAVQQSQKPKEYSDELNALVSDLLKQVIEEADQTSSQIAAPEKIEDLLAEFLPAPEAPSSQQESKPAQAAIQEPARPPVAAPAKMASDPEVQPQIQAQPQKTAKPGVSAVPAKTTPLFAAPAPSKRSIPKMALAIAGVVLVGGIAGFFILRSPSDGPEPKQNAAATAMATPVDAGTPQSAGQPAAPVDIPKPAAPASGSRSATENVPAKPEAAASKGGKSPEPATPKPAPVTETPAQQRVDPPVQAAVATPPPPVPAAATIAAPIEKPAAPSIAEAAKSPEPAIEKTPAPETPNVTSSAAAAPPEPPASAVTAPKNALSATPLVRVNPQYPGLAVRTRASSTVTLDVSIDSQGKVIKAIPISGNSLFHSEAVKAAMKWRYKPASIDGNNVPSQSKITFNFNLKN